MQVSEAGIDRLCSDELYEDVRDCYETIRTSPDVDAISCTRFYAAASLASDENGEIEGTEDEIVEFIVRHRFLLDFVLLNAIGYSSNE